MQLCSARTVHTETPICCFKIYTLWRLLRKSCWEKLGFRLDGRLKWRGKYVFTLALTVKLIMMWTQADMSLICWEPGGPPLTNNVHHLILAHGVCYPYADESNFLKWGNQSVSSSVSETRMMANKSNLLNHPLCCAMCGEQTELSATSHLQFPAT